MFVSHWTSLKLFHLIASNDSSSIAHRKRIKPPKRVITSTQGYINIIIPYTPAHSLIRSILQNRLQQMWCWLLLHQHTEGRITPANIFHSEASHNPDLSSPRLSLIPARGAHVFSFGHRCTSHDVQFRDIKAVKSIVEGGFSSKQSSLHSSMRVGSDHKRRCKICPRRRRIMPFCAGTGSLIACK